MCCFLCPVLQMSRLIHDRLRLHLRLHPLRPVRRLLLLPQKVGPPVVIHLIYGVALKSSCICRKQCDLRASTCPTTFFLGSCRVISPKVHKPVASVSSAEQSAEESIPAECLRPTKLAKTKLSARPTTGWPPAEKGNVIRLLVPSHPTPPLTRL